MFFFRVVVRPLLPSGGLRGRSSYGICCDCDCTCEAFFYDFRRRGYRAAIAPACVFESAPAELRRYSDDGWFRQRAFQGEHAFEVLREPGCLAENAKSREHHDGAETDGEEVR